VAAPSPSISDAELDVLKELWKSGPSTVKAVHARLRHRKRRWAYNTVATLLTRLRDKGVVESERGHGAALVFRAVVSRDKLLQSRLAELADRVCDGTASPLVHALIQGRKFSPEEIASLRRMVDELEN
jgi:BlaI family transcriptional regulator, penicillinase repressor